MRERLCERCGTRLHGRKTTPRNPYRYAPSGLDDLYLAGIIVRTCRACKKESPVIPRVGELHRVVASELLRKPARLSGRDLRFLRKNAGISAAEFAALLGVDPAHLSRFENGHTDQLGASADKLARAVVGAVMDTPEDLRRVLMDAAKKADRSKEGAERPTFKLERDRWRAA